MVEETNYQESSFGDYNIRLRDLEEKQRILKDRIFLLGKNLIEIKEKNNNDILDLKKEMEIMKSDVARIKNFLESLSGEFSNFARKEDLAILSKQAKMFQPLNFVTREEIKKILDNQQEL
jgi:hypothetical protein